MITRDPETGGQNMGMYRMQVYDDRDRGHALAPRTRTGGRIFDEVPGARPADARRGGPRLRIRPSIYASTAPLPEGHWEMLFAGFLRRRAPS